MDFLKNLGGWNTILRVPALLLIEALLRYSPADLYQYMAKNTTWTDGVLIWILGTFYGFIFLMLPQTALVAQPI